MPIVATSRSEQTTSNAPKSETIVVASFRRSGTHLTIDTIRHNFKRVDKEYFTFERFFPNHPLHVDIYESDIQLLVPNKIRIVKTHLDANGNDCPNDKIRAVYNNLLQRGRTIFVVRDVRDVMVSNYYYRRSFNTEVASKTLSEFILEDAGGDGSPIVQWVKFVNDWMSKRGILILRYEDLIGNIEDSLDQIASFAKIRKKWRTVDIPLGNDKFSYKLTGRKKSSAVQPRRGIVGDWKNHFDERVLHACREVSEETMLKLGYSWAD